MGKVVEGKFGQKKEIVFQCISCEAQSFWLDVEGTITCRACKAKQLPPKEWVERCLAEFNDGEVEE